MVHTNKVTLLGYYGSDETHCLSAWQSTGVEYGLDLDEYDVEQRSHILFANTAATKQKTPAELLKMLASSGHHTPFEKSTLHFSVTSDIASHIHCIKHRIGVSINTESARYKELMDDKYYLPSDWSKDEQNRLDEFVSNAFDDYHQCVDRLVQQGHTRKRAKESARYYLPYATQLNFDVQFNFRSFMHFQQLRNSAHAQLEIREIAQLMLAEVKAIPSAPFKLTLEAFGL